MLGSITSRSRGRLATYGMLVLLFVAGLAFATFENTAASRAMLSLGGGEDDEMPAVPTDPRLDPDDCLYDPEALKELLPGPHAVEQADATDTELPADHPQLPSTSSQTDGGSPNSTSPGTTPSGSPEAPGGAPEGSGGSPSDDTPDNGQDTPPRPPHEWGGESDCPGR